ncbi:hypothetical protein RRF57_009727 [Xylaria bambusicola]|uniref:Uncharacterized protein n=1 Tax=Xylaria bambusicola TaxID=326684 RepID=A0AAN7ZC52_9PEZI
MPLLRSDLEQWLVKGAVILALRALSRATILRQRPAALPRHVAQRESRHTLVYVAQRGPETRREVADPAVGLRWTRHEAERFDDLL